MKEETPKRVRPWHQKCTGFLMGIVLRLFFRLYGRWKIVGVENIPKTGPIIFAANHASYLDPLVGWSAIWGTRKMIGVAKEELWKNRVVAYFMDSLDSIPVKRHSADRTMFRQCLEVLERGDTVGIFPEGTRTYDGKLNPAEPGLALLYAKTKAPIVPVALVGTYEMFPRKAKKLRRYPLQVIFGQPITFEPGAGREVIGERVMQEIALLFTQNGIPMEPPSPERKALLPKEDQ